MENNTIAPRHASSRIWYVLGGILSIFVGFYAMNRPGLATLAVTKVIGILLLASGIVLFVAAVFGKARKHRWLDFLSAALRIAVGLILMTNIIEAVLTITLVLGIVFIIEGIFSLALGFGVRGKNPAWGWVLLNGVASLLLGGMLLMQWPESSLWAIGLLFGINCLFSGFALIMYGTALPKAQDA